MLKVQFHHLQFLWKTETDLQKKQQSTQVEALPMPKKLSDGDVCQSKFIISLVSNENQNKLDK
jgi:hypothetical protein